LKLVRFFTKCLVFSTGIIFVLLSLCYLIKFYDFGLDYDDSELILFLFFMTMGIPVLIFGVNLLSDNDKIL